MVTGRPQPIDDVQEDDLRRVFPRWQAENSESNVKLVSQLGRVANAWAAHLLGHLEAPLRLVSQIEHARHHAYTWHI